MTGRDLTSKGLIPGMPKTLHKNGLDMFGSTYVMTAKETECAICTSTMQGETTTETTDGAMHWREVTSGHS